MNKNYTFKVNQEPLNSAQFNVFTNFLLKIKSEKKHKLLFRGENIENLKNKLNIQHHQNTISRLNYFTFEIGEKGRVYQKEFDMSLTEKNRFSIQDTSEKVFNYIFRKINNIIKNSTNSEVLEFIVQNEFFINYFKEKSNKENFLLIIKQMKTNNERIKVKDYYLSFLHKIGRMGIHENSYFLSTSTLIDIAKKFSGVKDIIFVSWTTANYNIKYLLRKYELPVIEKNIYQYQREMSIKGALFPQDILGFIERSTNTFNINPNLFLYPNLIDFMILHGIPIDQSKFKEILDETNHSAFVSRNNNNEFIDNIKNL